MGKFKVLFISPNHDTEPRIPLAVSILISSLKEIGVQVKLFDTTFMFADANVVNKYKEEKGVVEKTDIDQYYGEAAAEVDPENALERVVKEFQPDLVAMTLVEFNFALGIKLLKVVKEHSSAPTLVGGILPIIAADMVIEQPCVDMICIGEGEESFVELVEHMRGKKPVDKLDNLWVKKDGQIIKNPTGRLVNINEVPFQNWDLFDERCIYKAFMGKVYRCGSFEMSRGCLKRCSFCVAPSIRKSMEVNKEYQRWKSPARLVDEIEYLTGKYKLDLVHFCDTNFLLRVDRDYLKEVSQTYQKRVGLPFMIQTGAETVNEETIKILKDMGCVTMSIGVESGSPKTRKEIMKKNISDEVIFNCFDLAEKYGIRTTANYMIGLPYETEEDVWESIEFNKKLNPPSIAVHYFVPFLGTELYDECVHKGFYPGFDPMVDLYKESPLHTDTLSKERIDELLYVFVDEYNKNRDKSN